MVSMVIISHSKKIAEGVKELALQMTPEISIAAAGGTKDESIGTDIDIILQAINKVYSEDGVVILFDLGSSLMNAEMALEFLSDDKKDKVKIIDAALVEGAITGAVEISMDKSLKEIMEVLGALKLDKMA